MRTFNPSYSGLGELLFSPEMQAAMHAKAKKIAETAAATSPVGPLTDSERQRYIDSWRVESGVRDEPSRRAVARVINDSDHAAAVEFGNGRTSRKTIEPHYTLTRAIDAARE
jgi:hypothetical protein